MPTGPLTPRPRLRSDHLARGARPSGRCLREGRVPPSRGLRPEGSWRPCAARVRRARVGSTGLLPGAPPPPPGHAAQQAAAPTAPPDVAPATPPPRPRRRPAASDDPPPPPPSWASPPGELAQHGSPALGILGLVDRVRPPGRLSRRPPVGRGLRQLVGLRRHERAHLGLVEHPAGASATPTPMAAPSIAPARGTVSMGTASALAIRARADRIASTARPVALTHRRAQGRPENRRNGRVHARQSRRTPPSLHPHSRRSRGALFPSRARWGDRDHARPMSASSSPTSKGPAAVLWYGAAPMSVARLRRRCPGSRPSWRNSSGRRRRRCGWSPWSNPPDPRWARSSRPRSRAARVGGRLAR